MTHGASGRLLSAIGSGIYSTRELIEVTGHSPNTVVKHLDDLKSRGLIDRVEAHKSSRGRPPTIHRLTPLGAAYLDTLQTSSFNLLRNRHGVLWGPRRASSFWGVSLFGRPDIFARTRITAAQFEVVPERNEGLYETPVSAADGVYPNLEAYIAWAAGSGNPRFLSGAAVLVLRHGIFIPRLRNLAARFRTTNRVGFLASLSGARSVAANLDQGRSWERMLETRAPVDDVSAKVAARWRVRNPLAATYVKEAVRLYGRPK